ncbi:hypothetical Protein YC6258_02121 [Gynuella sunshinyii YC6258]|uniref:Uncharacterized protein n=1 Tax=Gynuella sunshinyii YC6258 TaxID=1445510 RepID=A0A0C5VUT9_9GAMM|nr:hypothetical Protein YC6258_02121 [Gynuella sunshinyii YC6258]
MPHPVTTAKPKKDKCPAPWQQRLEMDQQDDMKLSTLAGETLPVGPSLKNSP